MTEAIAPKHSLNFVQFYFTLAELWQNIILLTFFTSHNTQLFQHIRNQYYFKDIEANQKFFTHNYLNGIVEDKRQRLKTVKVSVCLAKDLKNSFFLS